MASRRANGQATSVNWEDVHVKYLHVEPHAFSLPCSVDVAVQDHASKGAGATQSAGPGGHAPDAADGTGVTANNVVHTWHA